MKAIGIQKATRRLYEAEKHLTRLKELESTMRVREFEYEWSAYLTSINSVHEILKTSARSDPTSRQWFASREKRVIRKDALLRYLLHARGADYHGLQSGAVPEAQGAKYLGYTNNPPVKFISFGIVDSNGVGHTVPAPDDSVMFEGEVKDTFSFGYKLTSITDDLHGVVFDPPTTHLDVVLRDQKPSTVARLAWQYYRGLLHDAAKLSLTA
jgi:hypothetical protein